MSDQGSIYMNYQLLRQKADRLEELAGQLNQIADQRIDTCISISSWEGDAHDAYVQKATKLSNNIRERAKQLQKIAKGLRQAARKQEQLEHTLSSLFS